MRRIIHVYFFEKSFAQKIPTQSDVKDEVFAKYVEEREESR